MHDAHASITTAYLVGMTLHRLGVYLHNASSSCFHTNPSYSYGFPHHDIPDLSDNHTQLLVVEVLYGASAYRYTPSCASLSTITGA